MTAQITRFRDHQNSRDLARMHGNIETSLAKLNHMAAEVFRALMIDTANLSAGQDAEAATTEYAAAEYCAPEKDAA